MKKFARRGVPRKVGRDEGDEEDASSGGSAGSTPAVKRGTLGTKPKRPSSLRLSFSADEPNEEETVSTSKKKSLARVAAERNLELMASRSEDRPTYSKDYLAELKASTPSRPEERDATGDDEEMQDVTQGTKEMDIAPKPSSEMTTPATNAVDIAAKFGVASNLYPKEEATATAIPSEAEIREKKQRRARLAAGNQDFISFEDEDEEDRPVVVWDKEQYPETRLVPDDEDFAEGFDEFTEDGKVPLTKEEEKKSKEQRRREEILAAIAENQAKAEADALLDTESDHSDDSMDESFLDAQVRAGTYAQRYTGRRRKESAPKPPKAPKIRPIPKLQEVLWVYREVLEKRKIRFEKKKKKLSDLNTLKRHKMALEEESRKRLDEANRRFAMLQVANQPGSE
ncbi:hypothetical protein NA57DRAFT_55459 [Rhizodiscina lignyota]|uniref:Uncharacterized protein n=1 Tax=Rhizodiscina lignyota TaxID=1504668 RepID=A0A9P4M6N2_9PEZI|nr:hypothetical protein NA57DRAFT_55459 [Rhizodiscina lignyota]